MNKDSEKLLDRWIFHAYKSGNTVLPILPKEKNGVKTKSKDKKKQKKSPHQTSQHRDPFTTDAAQHLRANALVDNSTEQAQLKNRHTGLLSVAKSGVAFVAIGKGVEAVVPASERGAALHRDKVEVVLTGFNRGRFVAKVLKIVEPFSTEYLAQILGFTQSVASSHKKEKFALAELVDLPDHPQVLLKVAQGMKSEKRIVYVKRGTTQKEYLKNVEGAENKRPQMRGAYQRTTSALFEISPRVVKENRKGDLERLRLRYMLPGDFEKEIIPLKKVLDKRVKEEIKNGKRRKVEGRYIFTIDGADAKDFDDAIAVVETQEGFELDVHIADVGFFVPPESLLFSEALRRGNSYYLSGSVIPMLPEILSNEFCSLKPKTTRLAFTSRMRFDKKGKMIGYEFFKSTIYIDKRYTYDEAHENLKKNKSPLKSAMRLAKILIEARDKAGRVELNFNEDKILYDKNGRFVGITKSERLDSHRLVEECMLSANQAVAAYAIKFNLPILHRNHESMPQEKLERLNRYLEKYVPRLKLKSTEQNELNRVLNDAAVQKVKDVFQFLLLRSFMQANYAPEPKGHWGLAFTHYAHFTSPIRRVADLVTHIQLDAHLARKKFPFKNDLLDHYGREASRLERIAFEAEKSDKKLLAIRALQNRVGETFTGWLSSFSSDRLFITLNEFPAEGEIAASAVDKRGEIRVVDDFSIFSGRLQKTLSLGDTLKVRLVKADAVLIALKFEFCG